MQGQLIVRAGERSGNIKIASMLLIAFLAWLSAATWTSQASPAGRDEAISRCTAQAKKQYRQRGRGTVAPERLWPTCVESRFLRMRSLEYPGTPERREAAFPLLSIAAINLFGGYMFNIALSRRTMDIAGPAI